MKLILNLGCWGRFHNKFCLCKGVENEIIDLTARSTRNIEIENMLDEVYNLFDKPLYNNIHTEIWNIQEKFSEVGNPVFDKKLFKEIEDFCILHSKCGLYLRLELI